MSEYELSLLRQRGLAARDSKAKRGELRFVLPPGYCWNELGRIEMDPDERVVDTIRLLFRKLRELGSARQLFLWARHVALQIPVVQQKLPYQKIGWQAPAYHNIVEMMHNPIYAGAYAFGRTTYRTRLLDGRAKKTESHHKPMKDWNVLLRDQHVGYISWEEFEENQKCWQRTRTCKSALRARRPAGEGPYLPASRDVADVAECCTSFTVCDPAMHTGTNVAATVHTWVQVSASVSAVWAWIMPSPLISWKLSPHWLSTRLSMPHDRAMTADDDVRQAVRRELEEARYEASLAARRYDVVDPAKRLVARELESRWNTALERVAKLDNG